MCGRYASSRKPEDLVEEFEVDVTEGPGPGVGPAEAKADYNVAPTKQALVVLARRPRPAAGEALAGSGEAAHDPAAHQDVDQNGDQDVDGQQGNGQDGDRLDGDRLDGDRREGDRHEGERQDGGRQEGDGGEVSPLRYLRLLTWGLVPSWAKDRSVGSRMINARAESLLDKPAYRRAALSRRCLVPADGWYEWQRSATEKDARGKPRKQPFFIRPFAPGPIAFAGLYEFWRDPDVHADDPAAWLTTYTIVTTDAEAGLEAIHDRMPLVLPQDRWQAWLDPDLHDADAVRALLEPPVPGRFCPTPVTTRVNAVTNNGPELLEPAPAEQLHGVLDPTTGELLGSSDAPLF